MKRLLLLAACVLALAGCETIDPDAPAKAAMNEAIKSEAPGDYFIGRRMYKKDYKVWGWVRQPGQNWKSAKLVMLNEQKLLAPDRARNEIGSDNNYEYTLKGYYSGETVYEPASDRFYPEFVVTGFDVRSTNPPIIYTTKRQNDPAVRILMAPQI
jgi:hypothetical protein